MQPFKKNDTYIPTRKDVKDTGLGEKSVLKHTAYDMILFCK